MYHDRRNSDRFPIERELRYRVLNELGVEEEGLGKTINISSTGVLFTSEHTLLPGRCIELSISWPPRPNNKTTVLLVARGCVVRFEKGKAAMDIRRYEFRTKYHTPLSRDEPKKIP